MQFHPREIVRLHRKKLFYLRFFKGITPYNNHEPHIFDVYRTYTNSNRGRILRYTLLSQSQEAIAF